MRIWHKDLISVLPKYQLLGQWRECCAIARNIAEKGTPNHLLVNRVVDYPIDHLYSYCRLIQIEMIKRHYKCDFSKVYPYLYMIKGLLLNKVKYEDIFNHWHDNQYLRQCFYNLQEKFDVGGMTDEEYDAIHKLVISKGIKV